LGGVGEEEGWEAGGEEGSDADGGDVSRALVQRRGRRSGTREVR